MDRERAGIRLADGGGSGAGDARRPAAKPKRRASTAQRPGTPPDPFEDIAAPSLRIGRDARTSQGRSASSGLKRHGEAGASGPHEADEPPGVSEAAAAATLADEPPAVAASPESDRQVAASGPRRTALIERPTEHLAPRPDPRAHGPRGGRRAGLAQLRLAIILSLIAATAIVAGAFFLRPPSASPQAGGTAPAAAAPSETPPVADSTRPRSGPPIPEAEL